MCVEQKNMGFKMYSNYILYPDHQKLLEKVAFGNGDEYAYRDGGNDERTN